MGTGSLRAIALAGLLWACGDDDAGTGDAGADGGLPADGRLPGDDGDGAMEAVGNWALDHTTGLDLNPLLGDYPSSSSRAIAVLAEGATVGGVNSALDAAAVRIVGGVPGGTLFVEIAEPDFERLHQAVESLTASGAFEAVGEDLLLVGDVVPADANPDRGWTWDDKPGGLNWHLEHVRVPAAWSLVEEWKRERCSDQPSILVGAIDQGMHAHPDLDGVTWTPPDDSEMTDPEAGVKSHAMSIAAIMGAGSLEEADLRDDEIEGVNPWAGVVGRTEPQPGIGANLLLAANAWVFGDQERITAETSRLMGEVYALADGNRSLRAINISLSWPAGDPEQAFQLAAMGAGATAARNTLHRLVDRLGVDLAIFQSANNGWGQPTRYSSPFGMAAFTFSPDTIASSRVLVVEALGPSGWNPWRDENGAHLPPFPADWNGWDVTLAAFSNAGGHVSAPGGKVGSPCAAGTRGCDGGYDSPSGTSQATPVAAGIASLVAMVQSGWTMAQVVSHLRDPRVTIPPTAGSAAEEVDALNALLAIDGPQKSCGEWKRRLVDVDDGTEHGLRLFVYPEGHAPFRYLDRDGPDGRVDMADFRAWRTAHDYFQAQTNWDNLPDDHPKLDLNGNGLLRSGEGRDADVHEYHARQDFNGDGILDLDARRDVLGVDSTDLDVLAACFADTVEGWRDEDLPALARGSADLLLELEWVGPEVDRIRDDQEIGERLSAVELHWETFGGLAGAPGLTRRIEVGDDGKLPSHAIMTVPISGGPLEVTAILQDERRIDICAAVGDPAPLVESEVRPYRIVVSCHENETCCEDGCHDLQTDEASCGECGNACGFNQSCVDGSCVDNPCLPDERYCDGECYSDGSESVCEGCDSPCMTDQQCCGWACCDGYCCGDDFTECCADDVLWCDPEMWNGDGWLVEDTRSDPQNCGGCGVACEAGETCCNGFCVDTSEGMRWFSGTYLHCGACGNTCGPGQGCCGGACVSWQSEPNCGGCGGDCDGETDPPEVCCWPGFCSSNCESWNCRDGYDCDEGMLCGSWGLCIDIRSDPSNCGAEAHACDWGIFLGSEVCINGVCMELEESDDSQNCGGTGTVCEDGVCCHGRCVNTRDDSENCGACDSPIPNLPNLYCCDGAPTDVETDRDNCGGCGWACDPGFGCCDGYCVDMREDADNCGECGRECAVDLPDRAWEEVDLEEDPWPFAEPMCCDSQCVDMRYDDQNCGACGATCAGDEICCLGACVDPKTSERHCGGCHVDCGPRDSHECCDGECTDILTSAENCGGCGLACEGGQICSGGSCGCAL